MKNSKIFLFGLDNAGKTSLAQYIKSDSCETTLPTLAFNLDKWVIDDLEFQVWDAPGQIGLRKVWKNGINRANILMFVLDTSQPDRFQEAKQELDTVLNNMDTVGLPLLFCFHKLDLSAAQENTNLAKEIMKLPLIASRKVFRFETTVKGCEAVEDLKNELVKLVQDMRW